MASPGLYASCPDPAALEALREQADVAIAAGSSIDLAWERVRNQALTCTDPHVEADVLRDWAEAQRLHGNTGRSQAVERERMRFAQRHRLARHEVEARISLAAMDVARGELASARQLLEEALEGARRLGDVAVQAQVLTELSRLERRRGEYLAALRAELMGLELRRQLDPPPGLWRSMLSLATLYEQIELLDEARRYYAMALAEAEREGDPAHIGDALNGYSGFLNDDGAAGSAQALPMARRALEIHRARGDQVRIGSCLLQVGRALLGLGQIDDAELAFVQTRHLAVEGGYAALRAHVDFRWGELEFQRGNTALALQRIGAALEEYQRQGNRHRLIKVYGALEPIYLQAGDELAAARAGREHFRLRNELLGTNASGKLGELLTNFALAEAEHRNQRLAQENALTALRLENERKLRHAGYLIAGVIVVGLMLMLLRHRAMQRLNRLLMEKTRESEAQRAALAEANAQLIRITRMDALTGLASRTHGLEHLATVIAHARERGSTPALVLIDIDHFKDINDRHGHLAGDQVLCALAATLRELLPEDALAARVGGEEFMLVLEQAGHGRAELLADAVRRRVRDLWVDVGPQRVQVTISAGIAHLDPSAPASLRELYAAADHALYEAKRAGRDCVRTRSREAGAGSGET